VRCDKHAGQRTERGVLGTNTDDEHVEGNLSLGRVALDLRVVVDVYNALLIVDLGGLGLVVLDGGFLVAQEIADRLHDGAVLDGAYGARGKEWSEEEVVAGGDDNDIVVFRIELLQERDGAPASTCCRVSEHVTTLWEVVWEKERQRQRQRQREGGGDGNGLLLTENDQRLLAWVRLWLVMGVAHFVDAVANVAQAGDCAEVREAPCPAQQSEASPGLGWVCICRGSADGLAEGNLVMDRARRPLRSVGDKRRALRRRVGAAAGQLHLRH
jgi:hypothetical protein